MDVNAVVEYWLASAKDDRRAANHLCEKGDYSYALFFGHLYLEKLLKAVVVRRTGAQAPLVHNLRILADKANLVLSVVQEESLIRINEYNISARYPDFKFAFKKRCTKSFATKELKRIGD